MKLPAAVRGWCWLLLIGIVAPATRAQDLPLTPDVLQQLLQRFPAADTNGDGVLSEDEARAYYAKMRAAKAAPARSTAVPAPTWGEVAYGPAARQVLDFWKAESARPTPVVIYIHGGGFVSGDKTKARDERLLGQCLEAGVSFAAINYRYLSAETPLQDILRDCARAVQFIRAQAGTWNVDRSRLAAYGGSAGAGASVWLACHDDLAEPGNADPVLRESTRLVCAGSMSGQFSYDFVRWTEVFGAEAVERFGGIYRGPLLYGRAAAAGLQSPDAVRVRADCDLERLITKDDPPLFVSVNLPTNDLVNVNQFLHHPKHSQILYERCQAVGVPVVASIPALGIQPADGGPKTWRDFVFKYLGVSGAKAQR